MTAFITTSDERSVLADAALATPTDLNVWEASAVVDAVNLLIDDAFALYMRTKIFN